MYKYKTKLRSHSQWVIHEPAFCPGYFSFLLLLKSFEEKKKILGLCGIDFSVSLKHPELFFFLNFYSLLNPWKQTFFFS